MTTDELYTNIAYAFQQKRLSLNFDECPWEEEYKQGYAEGWHNAFMFAEQILEQELSNAPKADNEEYVIDARIDKRLAEKIGYQGNERVKVIIVKE